MTKPARTRTLRQSMQTATAVLTEKRSKRFRTAPNGTHVGLRALRRHFLMEGRPLTKADMLAAGFRPKRDDKTDDWAKLTATEKPLT